jgi:hypothetical protein
MPITLSAKVPKKFVNRLLEYSEETGTPIHDCLLEALDDFVNCNVRLRLEYLRTYRAIQAEVESAEPCTAAVQ